MKSCRDRAYRKHKKGTKEFFTNGEVRQGKNKGEHSRKTNEGKALEERGKPTGMGAFVSC